MRKIRYLDDDDKIIDGKIADKLSEINYQFKSKVSGFSAWLFAVSKFILGVLLLPFVYSSTTAFLKQFKLIDTPTQDYFWYGIITFLIIYLFIWEPAKIYTKGNRLLEMVFSYVRPLVKVAPYLVPIYTLVLFLLYFFLLYLLKSAALTNYFMFLFAFSLSLHLVFSSKALRSRRSDFLKGNYIFGFSFVYLLNIFIFCFFLNLMFEQVSFIDFCNQAYLNGRDIIASMFSQLFVNKT